MTSEPTVPAEAIRLGAMAAGTYEFVAEQILAAALPALRAQIAAEVLGPVRASDSDRRDVAAWLIREADDRVRFFPQRRDGVDALIRHVAATLSAPVQAAGPT